MNSTLSTALFPIFYHSTLCTAAQVAQRKRTDGSRAIVGAVYVSQQQHQPSGMRYMVRDRGKSETTQTRETLYSRNQQKEVYTYRLFVSFGRMVGTASDVESRLNWLHCGRVASLRN